MRKTTLFVALLFLFTLLFSLPVLGDTTKEESYIPLILKDYESRNNLLATIDENDLGNLYLLSIDDTLPEALKADYAQYQKIWIYEVFWPIYPPFRSLQYYAFGETSLGSYETVPPPQEIIAKIFDHNLFTNLPIETIVLNRVSP